MVVHLHTYRSQLRKPQLKTKYSVSRFNNINNHAVALILDLIVTICLINVST